MVIAGFYCYICDIMKRLLTLLALLWAMNSFALEREYIWPAGRMPDAQSHQIAEMSDVAGAPGFDASKNSVAFLEWYDAPAPEIRTDACMILISGGGYYNCCDMSLLDLWQKTFTAMGIQCVKFVYRTPRPEGLPIYQTAWEDGQRAVRMVRSEARKRGFDPEKIGTVSMSAGSHLAVLLATSSQTPAYEPIDRLDKVPCHINWAVVNAPAYVTTDSETGTPATRQGYGVDVKLSDCFKFDEKTCPMSLHHGGTDVYTPNGSTLIYRELRKRGIPAELHLYPDVGHAALGLDRAVEWMRQMQFVSTLDKEEDLLSRFPDDVAVREYSKKSIWPEGKAPDNEESFCEPYIEWYIPENLTTKAIQIIYSGGAYVNNAPHGFEVAPARRYLNAKGMTVVVMKYRSPRPTKLAKHTAAWQDVQRAVRLVRSEAASKGLDPDRIGIMGSSAGGHLTLMGVTSSLHQSYLPIDATDKLSCSVQWGVGIYPAYVLSDGYDGHNTSGGNLDEDIIAPEFSFDKATAPMLFIHGDADGYASMGSVKVWEKMRAMGIQSELHTLALREHCFQRTASPGTGSYTWLDRIWEFLSAKGFNK